MKFITKNFKTIGIIMAALILVAMAMILYSLITVEGSVGISIIFSLIKCIAMVAGLYYCLKGFGKDNAKYFKTFFIMLLAFDAIITILDIYTMITASAVAKMICPVILNLLTAVCVAVIAFGKDLGLKKSLIFILAGLVFEIVVFVLSITMATGLANIITCFGNMLIMVIAVMFVLAKYADKEARGRKI